MYSARDIFTMSLLLADFDRAALRVEGDERIAEQPFDVAAARHIRGRKVAQHGWVDQGDRVAERRAMSSSCVEKRMHLRWSCASRRSSVQSS